MHKVVFLDPRIHDRVRHHHMTVDQYVNSYFSVLLLPRLILFTFKADCISSFSWSRRRRNSKLCLDYYIGDRGGKTESQVEPSFVGHLELLSYSRSSFGWFIQWYVSPSRVRGFRAEKCFFGRCFNQFY